MTQARTAQDPETGRQRKPWYLRGGPGAGLLLIGMAGALGVIFAKLDEVASWAIKLDSVVLLIAGFVTVTLILYTGTVVMTVLGMRTPSEALGMPAGSIRALIAMVLILIFAIIGVVVLKQSSVSEVYTSNGLTQNQIDAIRAGGGVVLEQDLMSPQPSLSGTASPEPRYVAQIRAPLTPESHDFALQLLTTVSTLVVAVAGFYFGSKNLDAGAKAAAAARAPQRPAPELVPALPDRSRNEDPGDGGTSPEPPPEPEPPGPGAGGAAAPAVPGDGTPQVGGDTDGQPSGPEPPSEEGSPALPIETAESLGDEKPE
jgi:hypothetical protein